ncbi:MAG: glycoside hydrolase family 97 protein [Bacteroidales bacterium]|nr:glycoside hydrolase family 97 protein [Bacteroidales bacterium]
MNANLLKISGATICLSAFLLISCSNKNANLVTAPNGKISVDFCQNNDGNNLFSVTYNNTKVIDITKSAIFPDSAKAGDIKLENVSETKPITDNYSMIMGKRRNCSNAANERTYHFSNSNGNKFDIVFRAYNNGVVFRYVTVEGFENGCSTSENTIFNMSNSINNWLQDYDVSYEKFFPLNAEQKAGKPWAFPSLFEYSDSIFVLLTEADVKKYNSASWIKTSEKANEYEICNGENKTTTFNGWVSPWRVAIIGNLADIVEATLVTDVSEPCKVENTDWIKPGVVSWIYWAYNHGSNDFQIVKQYIDMASTLKLPYMLIDAEWDEMKNGGDINDAIKYANEKGVKLLIWYNSTTNWIDWAPTPKYKLNKPEDREKEFQWLQDNGIAGAKIDFFEGDKQSAMEYCIDLMESASKHNLTVNFHGATMPRGWQRTYPNLLSTEAILGAEWYNNAPFLTNKAAAHNATIPFTRGVVGSMDYTPCTFTDSQHPHITSHAHELALTVLFESGLLHLADRPSSYLSQPQQVQDFFTNLPTVWDETKLLDGYPAKFVVMARQFEGKWFVAGINGLDNAQEINIDWSKINLGNCSKSTIFLDGENAENPWNISNSDINNLPKSINCKERGGFVIVIE